MKIQRRTLITALAGSLAIAGSGARSQQAGRVYRIGYLSAPSRASVEQAVQAFLKSLRDLGWIVGKNLVIEYRWAEGNIERLPGLAAELVRGNVDLIVAPAAAAVLAAKNATRTIPIVMIFPADPVGAGLVSSLSLQQVETTDPANFESAFAAMAHGRAEAAFNSRDSQFLVYREQLASLAVKGRLPTMCNYREIVEAGGLMAYAVNQSDFIARAASYVDRIPKGAKPGDLPIEQPTRFDLTLNLKTARAIGLTIAQSLLMRADEVFR